MKSNSILHLSRVSYNERESLTKSRGKLFSISCPKIMLLPHASFSAEIEHQWNWMLIGYGVLFAKFKIYARDALLMSALDTSIFLEMFAKNIMDTRLSFTVRKTKNIVFEISRN